MSGGWKVEGNGVPGTFPGAGGDSAAALQAYPNFGGQVVMHMIRRVGPGIMQPIQIRGMNREILVQLDRNGTDRVL